MNRTIEKCLAELNPGQREAVTHGSGPLLIVAGAGTGKTRTLARRVSYLISQSVAPERILLLTFTRRASEEMLRQAASSAGVNEVLARQVWGGTFHAVANRLLRIYAKPAGLSPDFTILDRSDAEDFLNVIRNDMLLSSRDKRFPRKSTCLSIYSRCVNGDEGLKEVLRKEFPWCLNWDSELNQLFLKYVERKQKRNVLDYDDLLLYWHELLREEPLARSMEDRFDHILVDEYQDTNPIQFRIVQAMRGTNQNITVVGDDAQSIYSFRSATVRNMLDFQKHFPDAEVVTLEQNYRSLQPILDTTNRVIAQARERHSKKLWSQKKGGRLPHLITCVDETHQDETVIRQVLEHYEQGILLRNQAVLFRAACHSNSLELTLTRRNIPFRKYGGLRFLEAAHVKDLICILRIIENPRDEIAWFRILQLLSGVGPATAAAAFEHVSQNGYEPASLAAFDPPAAAADHIEKLATLLTDLQAMGPEQPSVQIERISGFYRTLLERNYEDADMRANDIEHLGRLAQECKTRRQFLSQLVLDPPLSTGDLAGPPVKDEDWLVLSTIHSAKGLEWDAVYLIHAADGCLPSDMATGSDEGIDEELRLAYVAMTRARDFLYVLHPLRYYHKSAGPLSDNHSYAQLCRFFTPEVTETMECLTPSSPRHEDDIPIAAVSSGGIQDRITAMWR